MVHVKGTLSLVILSLLAVDARVWEVCPFNQKTVSRVIYASSGDIGSHNGYDSGTPYGQGLNCTLIINTDPGKIFKVKLTRLSIEPKPDSDRFTVTSCEEDALEIDTGERTYIRCYRLPIGQRFEEFKTVSNKLVIRFRSKTAELAQETYKDGFELSFTTENKPAPQIGDNICPSRHIKKKRSGTIFSPGFPGNYGNNQNCRIKIPIPDNFQLNVWFSDFSLQRSLSCRNDYLTMRDEHGGVKLCGEGTDKLPGVKHFMASLATFHFRSDSSVQKTGFRLNYNMTRLTEGHCMCSTGSSYMCITNFNRKVRRAWHRIKFSIKTSQKSGLIVYSHKGNYRDYMYIAIQDGKMYYKSDLGTGPSMAVSHGLAIDDNKWHYVEIRRRKRSLTIAVDNGRAVGSAKTQGDFYRIDLNKSTGYVLGTPPQLQGMPNFIGCIRDFTIDGREPLTNSYVSKPDYHGHGIVGMKKC